MKRTSPQKSAPHQNERHRQLKLLGRLIRDLRKDSGQTGLYVANEIGIHHTRLSRIENGYTEPRTDELFRIFDVFNPDESIRERILSAHSDVSTTNRYDTAITAPLDELQRRLWSRFQKHECKSFQMFGISHIPGLLQTPVYAKTVFTGVRSLIQPATQPDEQARAVRARMEAQEILLFNQTISFRFIVFELAIHIAGLSAQDKAAQCHRIVHASYLPNVELFVVPYGKWAGLIPSANFSIFDNAFIQTELTSGHIEDESNASLSAHQTIFDTVASNALTAEEAREYLCRTGAEAVGVKPNNDIDIRSN